MVVFNGCTSTVKKNILSQPVPVSCEENEVVGGSFPCPLITSDEITGTCLNSIAGPVEILLQVFLKPNFFQWLITSLFQEKNPKYFLAEK